MAPSAKTVTGINGKQIPVGEAIKVVVTDYVDETTTFFAADADEAKRLCNEEVKWESCVKVACPALGIVLRGDFAKA